MIANQIKGKGFRGAFRYNLDKVNKGVAEVLDYSFAELSEKTIMKEVEFRRMGHPNLKKFFYHTSINFPPYENVSNATMKLIAHDYLQLNGFTEHQYLVFRHNDATHPHMHIMVNRIGANGKVLSDSNDFERSEKALRVLELKYNLTQVVSSKQAKARAVTKDELEMMMRTNQPSHKLEMQVIIKNVLNSNQKLTSSEFIQALKSKGIDVRFNEASTGYVSGISYFYDGMTITGSKLGNDFKWTTIKNVINYDQESDRTVIHEVNTRTQPIYPNPRADASHTEENTTALPDISGKHSLGDIVYKVGKLNNGSLSKIGRRSRKTSGISNTKTKEDHSRFLPNSKGLYLASLLDVLTNGNPILVAYQADLDIESALGFKRKKKKRKKRKL